MDGDARPAYSMKSPERLIRRLPRPVHGPHHCACTSTTARQVGSASSTLVFQSTSLMSGVMNFCDILVQHRAQHEAKEGLEERQLEFRPRAVMSVFLRKGSCCANAHVVV